MEFKKVSMLVMLTFAFFATITKAQNHPLAQCGGDVSGDADSLSFPGPGDTLKPGDFCVWTIHLETRTNFRFEMRNLSIGSNYTDCRDGNLRMYSLTNLAPIGDPSTYCDILPAPAVVFIPNSIAVIILYIDPENTNPGRGFNISWTGTNTDPLGTTHLHSFSTAEQGIIKYPIVGDYEPNLMATWLVKTISPQQSTRSDLSLNSIRFESCSASSPCLCDALILYQITPTGLLNETRRFCGEESSAMIENIESRFILAFFTDFETEAGAQGGFEVIYYPTDTITTTPTTTTSTTTPTTTTTFRPSPDTPCGTILSETVSGRITYKPATLYSPNERCVWTIRIQNANGITFTLIQSGIAGSDPDDGISVSTFSRSDPPLRQTEFMRYEGLPVTLQGSIATVTFQSDDAMEGLGFVLEYRATNFTGGIISPLSTDFISTTPFGYLDHPISGQYENNELSTFVITTPNFSVNSSPRLNVTWTKKELETTCYDYVVVYKFYPDPNAYGGWSQYDLYCATSPKMTTHQDMLLYVFKTDGSVVKDGFSLEWMDGN